MNGNKLLMSRHHRNPWHYKFKDEDINCNDWLIDTKSKLIDEEFKD
jgi:hypothetical protein